MSGSELAALITACGVAFGAIVTAIAALRNSNNNKEVVERLKEQIADLKDHNVIQDRILLDRESKIDKLTAENKELREKIRTVS